ncbi:CLUMA_CG014510, isoform A [Clunio marinus]|uniref:CLUMA_CG014510, isoform A n=1 Tax=Clunio marinus TaxID=568069 RepID=A0A1J1INR0_9DIPT|nr:CLUMA_CG014510, isoform A [Clunio marinus]
MQAKIIIFFGLVALSQAGAPWQAQPAAWKPAPEEPANYEFNYNVNDPSTGDVKFQQEHAQNGAIKGVYKLNDADGFLRIVEYTADDVNGFKANVRPKIIIFFGLVALSQAGAPWQAQPAAWKPAPEEPANYEFNYNVNEPSTGDVKFQQENAQNGVIKGVYKLNDADGFLRIVEYPADDVNGFKANVRRIKAFSFRTFNISFQLNLYKTTSQKNTMQAKIIIFFGLVALSQAGAPWQAQPAAWKPAPEEPANYEFNYNVNEPSTGDVKFQQEHADNGAIKGVYKLNDADGFLRIVEYTADDVNGFKANVRREPLQKAGWEAKPAAPWAPKPAAGWA